MIPRDGRERDARRSPRSRVGLTIGGMSDRLSPDAPFRFKFQFLGANGQAKGLFRSKGRFDGDTLVLKEDELPAAALLDVVHRDDVLIFAVPVPDEDGGAEVGQMAIKTAGAKPATALKGLLDVARSATWAKNHRRELDAKGEGGDFRARDCPHCTATVVLSGMPDTPQVFCPFCEALFNTSTADEAPKWEKVHRVCDECGYFSAPRKFTVFYFYFLLVVYGWRSRTTFRCPACMRGDAWKMLIGNAPFVLGVPVALTQLARTYGSDLVGGPYAGLDAGNKAARKGKFDVAVEKYRAILDRVGAGAGVKYNLGLALLGGGDRGRAADALQASLADCANYAPAYRKLAPLLTELDRTDEAEELERQWA